MLKKLRQRIFYDSHQNTGRQYEMDLARAMMIFLLAFIHLGIECSTDEGLLHGIPYFLDSIVGGPFSAPTYMFVMGVGVFYAGGFTFRRSFMRGVRIFILAYVLNIFRFLIPSLIGYGITGEKEKYLDPLLFKVLGNDILTFAGLALIVLAALIYLKIPKWGMLLLGIVFSLLGTLFIGVDVKNDLGNIFLGYLVGTEDAAGMVVSDFPLLNWLIFPIAGYLFASILVRVREKKLLYLLISPICAVYSFFYLRWEYIQDVGMLSEGENVFYHMTSWDAFASLTLVFALIGFYYFVSLVLPGWLMRLAVEISRNITLIYCIHWVFVFVIADLVLYIVRGTQILNSAEILLIGLAISVVSMILAHYYVEYKKRRSPKP